MWAALPAPSIFVIVKSQQTLPVASLRVIYARPRFEAGAAGTSLAAGTLRRGGTTAGTGILVGLIGLGVAALALVPFLGYLEAAALPVVARRARRLEPERYAGLRTLARD